VAVGLFTEVSAVGDSEKDEETVSAVFSSVVSGFRPQDDIRLKARKTKNTSGINFFVIQFFS
jgi:hypothetical protein